MGNFISVYAADPGRMNQLRGSTDAHSAILAAHPETDRDGLARLFAGAYTTDGESDDAGPVLYAFQMLCETFAPSGATVEIYLDEDHFPTAWNFVCGAEDPPFPLPVSSSGTPAVAYLPTSELPNQLDSWQETAAAESPYAAESGEIAAVLQYALRHNLGVYLFVTE